jgi:TetR/AcrR family transcriptional repressor of nem operon
MSPPAKSPRNPAQTRQRLLDATLGLMLRQGFAASTVDQICAEAGVTKGSFFHYFESKEAIARAAVDAFAQMGTDLYTPAWSDPTLDPLKQLHRLLDIMISFNQRTDEPCVCMVGMMSQELSRTNPEMRAICTRHLTDWADRVTVMLTEAKKIHSVRVDFDPETVSWFLNSLWQGSMLIGKTRESPEMVIKNIQLARQFIDSLFDQPTANNNA